MDLTKVFFTHDIRKGIKFDAILKWGGVWGRTFYGGDRIYMMYSKGGGRTFYGGDRIFMMYLKGNVKIPFKRTSI